MSSARVSAGWIQNFDNFISGLNKQMKFRETAEYQKYFDAFGDALKAYQELAGPTDGLEDIMLVTYSWAKFIRKNNSVKVEHKSIAQSRPVDVAIMSAVEILDEPYEYCVPLYLEADALDTLSFSAYMALKNAGEINYCKHCKKFLATPCRTHKEPTSADDLIYCRGCHGYLTTVCEYHGPTNPSAVFPNLRGF